MENPNPSTMHNGTNKHLETLKDILLTYNVYNTTLGYVQGMSDLLSPIYAVMNEEYLAFWSFVGYMERMVRGLSILLYVLIHFIYLEIQLLH